MRSLLALGFIAYPFVMYFLLERTNGATVVGVFALLAGSRLIFVKDLNPRYMAAALFALAAFCLFAYWDTQLNLLKLYPMLISLAGATYASYTLWQGPTAIERLAVAMGMQVTDRERPYTRGVTKLWVGFFCLNAMVAAYTALATSTATWALYNGLISYLVIGVLLLGEYLFRGWYDRQYLDREQ